MYYVSIIAGIIPWMLASIAFTLPILWLATRSGRLVSALFAFSLLLCLAIAVLQLDASLGEGVTLVYPFGGWPPSLGIIYYIDLAGALLIFFSSLTILAIGVYSIWYAGGGERATVLFYVLFLGLSAGLLGSLHTGDIFNLFVMIEVTAVSAYALVAFHRERREAVEAALKYGILGALATTLYFLSVVTIYASYGSLTMADIALKSRDAGFATYFTEVYGAIAVASAIALALALWSFTFKSALAPNHFWLIDAHPEAPAPVSAALSGLVVNIGVYATARFLLTMFGEGSVVEELGLLRVFGLSLVTLGVASALLGALMMAVQRDSKRLLAYSTVSHIGLMYVALGFAALSSGETRVLCVAAVFFHMITHSLGKSLLFLAVGVAERARGSRDLDALAGYGREAPIVGFSVVVGSLSLLGVPFTAGFFSKLLMYRAFIEGGSEILAIALIAVSAVSAMGYFKLVTSMLSGPGSRVESTRAEPA
ncbi:MAG: proton-conducting transporter membrane subunit, partial [Acidilobaceae archaeon]